MLPLERLKKTLAETSLAAWLAATALLAWLFFVCDAAQVFEFDSDDGNNVIKALLVLEGHSFGDEIWSDQPPVFTFVLAGAFRALGTSMEVARGIVALFSASIVFLSYDLLRRIGGHIHALAGCSLLFLSYRYVHLSLSVMIGLPAIAWALAAAYCLERSHLSFRARPWRALRRDHAAWQIVAAGALGAFSLGTKMFTAPIVLLEAATACAIGAGWLREGDAAPSARERARGAALAGGMFLSGGLLGSLLAYAPLLEAGTLSGLVEAHARSRVRASGGGDGLDELAGFLQDDAILFTLGAAGALLALRQRRAVPLFFLCWVVVCFLALYDHHPVWTHHRTLLTIPGAWLAGYALGEIASPRVEPNRALGGLGLALITCLVCFSDRDRLETAAKPQSWSTSATDWRIFEAFSVPAGASRYVAAARPSHAFRSGRPIPPNLAVTSSKRFVTGLLTPSDVAASIEQYHPETILLSERWPTAVRRKVTDVIASTHIRTEHWRYQRTELWVEQRLAERLGLEDDSPRRRKRTSREHDVARPASKPHKAPARAGKKPSSRPEDEARLSEDRPLVAPRSPADEAPSKQDE